jgi:hypothetical protein
MSAKRLEKLEWFRDCRAERDGEPGVYHSYMASLATTLHHISGELDAAWLMGSSGFAFRSFVCQTFCPSAMSIFNWSAALPEAVEQAGYHCTYVSRMWDEEALEEAKRGEAHAAIVEGVERGAPAIAWDVHGCEWGLITGYDEGERSYQTMTDEGQPSSLAFEKLGRNGIDILSVAIPGEPNDRGREESVVNSLKVAVAHAEGAEWTERPAYENGLAGYEAWAAAFDKWFMIVDAGRGERLPKDLHEWVRYYAGHHYSARCYARDYLRALSIDAPALRQAADCYEEVASHLKPVWERSPAQPRPEAELLSSLSESIRSARAAEERGIEKIREYLAARGEKTATT